MLPLICPAAVANIAADYEKHGVACLTVLTGRQFFQGSTECLQPPRSGSRRRCRASTRRIRVAPSRHDRGYGWLEQCRPLYVSGKNHGDGALALPLSGSGADDDFNVHARFGKDGNLVLFILGEVGIVHSWQL